SRSASRRASVEVGRRPSTGSRPRDQRLAVIETNPASTANPVRKNTIAPARSPDCGGASGSTKVKYVNETTAPIRLAGTSTTICSQAVQRRSPARITESLPKRNFHRRDRFPLEMIGSSPLRKGDERLLTGGGRFLDDLARDGLLHLGVVRSAEAHARIVAVVTDAARRLPGVVLAWSAADLGKVAPNVPTPSGGSQKGRAWAQPVLARDVVRHVGEPVAIVVAESFAQLADALDAVTIEYVPLPPLATAEASLASAERLHEGWPDNTPIVTRGAVGDPESAMAGAHLVVRERLRHPRLSAAPIETRGVVAYRDPDKGTLVVSSSTQSPYTLRDVVAAALGLPVAGDRVAVPDA